MREVAGVDRRLQKGQPPPAVLISGRSRAGTQHGNGIEQPPTVTDLEAPRSLRSSDVRLGRRSAVTEFSRNAVSYWPRSSARSQSVTSIITEGPLSSARSIAQVDGTCPCVLHTGADAVQG